MATDYFCDEVVSLISGRDQAALTDLSLSPHLAKEGVERSLEMIAR